jgi:hypothetical protein
MKRGKMAYRRGRQGTRALELLRDNLGMVMQGVGVVVPLFATYDKKSSDAAKVFFYDA